MGLSRCAASRSACTAPGTVAGTRTAASPLSCTNQSEPLRSIRSASALPHKPVAIEATSSAATTHNQRTNVKGTPCLLTVLGCAIPVHRRPRGGRAVVVELIIQGTGALRPARPSALQDMAYAHGLRQLRTDNEPLQRLATGEILRQTGDSPNIIDSRSVDTRRMIGKTARGRSGPKILFVIRQESQDGFAVGIGGQTIFATKMAFITKAWSMCRPAQ